MSLESAKAGPERGLSEIVTAFHADSDGAGVLIFLTFLLLNAQSLVLVAISPSEKISSKDKPSARRQIVQTWSTALLDQVRLTSFILTFTFCRSFWTLSAYTRKCVEISTSLNINSNVLLISSSRQFGSGEVSLLAVTTLSFFSTAIFNALHKVSVADELALLKDGVSAPNDTSLLERLLPTILVLAGNSVLLSVLGFRGRLGIFAESVWALANALVKVSLVIVLAFRMFQFQILQAAYEPYVEENPKWQFHGGILILCALTPVFSGLEAYLKFWQRMPRPGGELVQIAYTEQDSSLWYLNILALVPLLRQVKTVVILLFIAFVVLGLVFLPDLWPGNRMLRLQNRPSVARSTYLRNFLHYALWWKSSDHDYGAMFSALAGDLFSSSLYFMKRHRVPTGYRRISWRCSCGKLLAANFDNTNPIAFQTLEQNLHSLSGASDAGGTQREIPDTDMFLRRAQEDLPHIPADFVKTTKAFNSIIRTFLGDSELGWLILKPKIEKEWEDSNTAQAALSPAPELHGPLNDNIVITDDHNQGVNNSQNSGRQLQSSDGMNFSINTPTVTNRRPQSLNISQTVQTPKYFELCVTAGENSIVLDEINITSVTNDGQLFSKIWESYKGIERSALNKWFFKLDDVFFVHFGVTKRHQVGIYGKPMEIPPPQEVQEGRYHYSQCPMQPLPPMPDHVFLHYLDWARRNTGADSDPLAHAEDVFLNRLPKKLRSSIFNAGATVDATISYGWGVHVIERPSAFAQSMVGIFSALICLIIFGITWRCKDVGTAIGVGQFVAGVLALANAAIYFALQAYSTGLSRRSS